MMDENNFYQISGYRAHSNGWYAFQYNDKPMIDEIASNISKEFRPGGQHAPLELVLGSILPSGASYVLMTTEQMLKFTHMHRLRIPRGPWRATDFTSLSPIYFASHRELSAKLTTYKQRPRNKNRRGDEVLQDNSQANRGYIKTGTNAKHYRAYFEQQRTLYHLMSRLISPEKFSLLLPSWLGAVRVVSIVFVQWAVDKRPRSERLNNPQLIEVGYTDVLFPEFFNTLTGTTQHLKIKKKMTVKNPLSKTKDKLQDPHHSVTEEIDEDKLSERLRTVFNHDVHKSDVPLILLCHDEEMTLGILNHAGIDTSSYESGLDNLLPLRGRSGVNFHV
ncbi:hypothetical protein J3A83DRAFT_4092903 [Scleroderma citrinum]